MISSRCNSGWLFRCSNTKKGCTPDDYVTPHNEQSRLQVIIYIYDIYRIYEGLAADRTKWRRALRQYLKTGEDELMTAAAEKRARRKEGSNFIRPYTILRSLPPQATLLQPSKKVIQLKKKHTLGCITHGHL